MDRASLELIARRLRTNFGLAEGAPFLLVEVSAQRLFVVRDGTPVRSYPVSTSKYGTGSAAGSRRTPLGVHRIVQKIGAGAPVGAVFQDRRPTGEIVSSTAAAPVDRDLITTRILWLEGLEEGINRGQGLDTFERYIYIHGTPQEGKIGTPASHGCIRMRNADVVELFDSVDCGILVVIVE